MKVYLGVTWPVCHRRPMGTLQALMKHPSPNEAKQNQSRWLNRDQVFIAQAAGAATPATSKTGSSGLYRLTRASHDTARKLWDGAAAHTGLIRDERA